MAAAPIPLPHMAAVIDGRPHRLYFSFDDHPCPGTSGMLSILRRHRIRATFFVCGWGVRAYYAAPHYAPNRRHLDRLLAIKKSGHVLGNHSLNHPRMCADPDKRQRRLRARRQILWNQQVVRRATGVTMRLFRPPSGIWCRSLWLEMRRANLRPVMWHIADYKKSAAWMWHRTRARVRHGRNHTILLFHCMPQKLKRYLALLGRRPVIGKGRASALTVRYPLKLTLRY